MLAVPYLGSWMLDRAQRPNVIGLFLGDASGLNSRLTFLQPYRSPQPSQPMVRRRPDETLSAALSVLASETRWLTRT